MSWLRFANGLLAVGVLSLGGMSAYADNCCNPCQSSCGCAPSRTDDDRLLHRMGA